MNHEAGPKRAPFDGCLARPLTLLLLGISEEDASTVIGELARAGFEPRWRSVSTETDYRKALDPDLDLVLADYQIAGWSMPEALDLLLERGWDIPFIVFSGVAGEERAVAAMRQGASDYVLKDRLPRLGPAVRIALERKRVRSERREHEASLALAASSRSEARYRALFYDNPMPMFVFDQETHAFLAVNDAAIDHYGYAREQFLRMRVEDIRPADELPRLARTLADKGPGIEHVGTWRHLTRDGREIRVEITTHAIEFAGRTAIVVLANDVTERFEQQHKLSRMSRIRAVTAGITSAIVRSTDRAQLLQEACQVACTEGVFEMAWAGLIDPETGDGRMVASCGIAADYRDLFRFTSQPDRPDSERPLSRCARFGTSYVCNDIATAPEVSRIRDQMVSRGHRSGAVFPLRTRDGVFGVFAMSAAEAGFFDHEEVALLEWLATDLSYAFDRMAKSERLDYLAYYDVLTGLPNGTLFRDRLGQFARSAFHDQRQVTLVVIEIVHLKRINDILGRQAGDDALRKVADRLRVTVDDSDSLGRLGTTTFAVARTCDETDAATCLLNRLHDAFEEPFELDGKALRIGVRVGIATYPVDADAAEALLACAETALDHAKSSDEEAAYFSREQSARMAHRAVLEDELRLAIANRQFVLHFQPRADLVSGELVGAEALIRWQHPQRGLLLPDVFIGLAEETGLIVPIGAWVIEAVCAQQAAWIAANVEVVPVAVNVSSVQFARSDLLGLVKSQLAQHRLEARHLEIELTETAVMRDCALAARTLAALRALGVGLALDDFGTGYSSLAQLKRFPFGSVKIDRVFVADITRNAEDAAIATAIIAMAHQLGLKVVAEGVETGGQLTYLRLHGCGELQGHYFSPAVPASDFEAMLVGRKRLDLPERAANEQQTLLIVDDEPGILAALNRVLRRDGFRILLAGSGSEALDLLAVNPVQVIISDQRMPEMSGTAFLSVVKQLYPDTMRIVLSGYTDLAAVTEAVNRGAVFKFLTKPWDDNLLREQVRDAFRRHRTSGDSARAMQAPA